MKNGKLKSWEAKSSEVNQKTEVVILKKRECQTGQIGTLIEHLSKHFVWSGLNSQSAAQIYQGELTIEAWRYLLCH